MDEDTDDSEMKEAEDVVVSLVVMVSGFVSMRVLDLMVCLLMRFHAGDGEDWLHPISSSMVHYIDAAIGGWHHLASGVGTMNSWSTLIATGPATAINGSNRRFEVSICPRLRVTE